MKLSNAQKEEQLKASCAAFVADTLRQRYQLHASDAFLAFLLFRGMQSICWKEKPRNEEHLEHPYERRENLAYEVSVPIFEHGMEHACRAGGNGHHVAQSFAAHMREFNFQAE